MKSNRTWTELGAHTFGFVWQGSVLDVIAQLSQNSFRTFQLLASPPHIPDLDASGVCARAIRAEVDAVGGTVLSLDLPVSEINIASPIREVVEFSVDYYRKAIDFAAAIGAKYITVTSGRRHALLPPPIGCLDGVFEDAFVRIADYAHRAGLRVLFENHPQGFRPDIRSMMKLCSDSRLQHVDILYDVANGVAIGEDPVEGLRVAKARLGAVHFSDSPLGAWRHDPIGTGEIDFASILGVLDEIAFRGPCIAEIISDKPLQDLLDARSRLGELRAPATEAA
mgnify:CR=1 FL=1